MSVPPSIKHLTKYGALDWIKAVTSTRLSWNKKAIPETSPPSELYKLSTLFVRSRSQSSRNSGCSLQPCARPAADIARADALRDDAFKAKLHMHATYCPRPWGVDYPQL